MTGVLRAACALMTGAALWVWPTTGNEAMAVLVALLAALLGIAATARGILVELQAASRPAPRHRARGHEAADPGRTERGRAHPTR